MAYSIRTRVRPLILYNVEHSYESATSNSRRVTSIVHGIVEGIPSFYYYSVYMWMHIPNAPLN